MTRPDIGRLAAECHDLLGRSRTLGGGAFAPRPTMSYGHPQTALTLLCPQALPPALAFDAHARAGEQRLRLLPEAATPGPWSAALVEDRSVVAASVLDVWDGDGLVEVIYEPRMASPWQVAWLAHGGDGDGRVVAQAHCREADLARAFAADSAWNVILYAYAYRLGQPRTVAQISTSGDALSGVGPVEQVIEQALDAYAEHPSSFDERVVWDGRIAAMDLPPDVAPDVDELSAEELARAVMTAAATALDLRPASRSSTLVLTVNSSPHPAGPGFVRAATLDARSRKRLARKYDDEQLALTSTAYDFEPAPVLDLLDHLPPHAVEALRRRFPPDLPYDARTARSGELARSLRIAFDGQQWASPEHPAELAVVTPDGERTLW